MESPAFDLKDKVGILLRKAHARASQIITRHLTPHRLSPRHYSTLCILSYGEYSQKQIAEMIAVTENVMLELADDLEKRKLISRRRFSDDKRQYRLALTAQGHQVYNAATELLANAHQEMARDFAPDEWRAGLDFLLRLCALKDEEYPGSGR